MPTKADLEMQERKFLSEFFDVYKSLPALWNSKKKIYYDRLEKAAAYKTLVNKYREMYPDATREDVTKKINGFRSNYRNRLRKYYKCLRSAKDKDLVPKPTLWYYEKFSFLNLTFDNLDVPMDASNVYGRKNNSRNVKEIIKININDTEHNVNENDGMITDGVDNNSLASSRISIKEELQPQNYNENESYIESEMDESNTRSVSDRGDEYYHWAMALAADIRKMNKTQQIYAKKAIAEVVMEGGLGLLHRNSIQINEDPL